MKKSKNPQEVDLSQFAWDRNLSGYEVIDALVPRRMSSRIVSTDGASQKEHKPPLVNEKFLVDRRDSEGRFYRYPVLHDETGLFRTFADTDWRNTDEIIHFANRYGRLGTEELIGNEAVWGERLQVWREEIQMMRRMILLSDWIKEGYNGMLSKLIVWADDGRSVHYIERSKSEADDDRPIDPVFSCGVRCVIASDDMNRERIEKMKCGDPVLPAWHYIQQTTNARLQGHAVCPRLLWEDQKLGFFIAPVSLIGALWLQLADALARKPKFGRCLQCQKWFEFTRGKRRDSKFCTTGCKNRWHRENSKESSQEVK